MQICSSKNDNIQIHQYIERLQDFESAHIFISGHFHVLSMRKPHFQCNANREVVTTSPRFCNEPHLLHVPFRLYLTPPSHPGQSTTLL